MSQQELVRILFSNCPDEPRPVHHAPIQLLAELSYDPSLADDVPAQLRATSDVFRRAMEHAAAIAGRFSRLATEYEEG